MPLKMFAPTTFLLGFIFWNLQWHGAQGVHIPLPSDKLDVITSIIEQFSDWDFVIHMDVHVDLVRLLLHKNNENPLTIFNYSDLPPEAFYRPNTIQCVHFVSYKNTEFLQFTKPVENINEMDVIIFLADTIASDANYTHWYESGVDNANSVYVISRTKAIAVYFYSAPESAPFVLEVHRDEAGIAQLYPFRNTYRNFRGFSFKIGYTDCPPYMYDMDGALVGVEFEVLKALGRKLNMTPIMDDYSSKFNARFALVKAVNNSQLHFAVGCLANNIKRNEMVSFSAALQAEPHITVYASVDGRYGPAALYAVTAPLEFEVWLCSAGALIIMMIFAKLIMMYDPVAIPDATLIPPQILIEQSTYIPRQSNALRLGLVGWMLVGFSLSSSYKSKLTAALMIPEMNEPEELDELLDQGYHFISPATDSTYLIELLQFSTDPTEYRIGRNIEDTKLVCEAIERALVEISAVVEERSVIRYELWNHCFKNLTKKAVKSLRRLKADTTVNGHVWAMQKAAPYKNMISLTLERMMSYGLIDKWYKAYNLSRPLIEPNSRMNSERAPLRPVDLVSAWIIIGVGCVVSSGAFLFELCVRATKNVTLKARLVHTDSRTQLQPKLEALTEEEFTSSHNA